MRLDVLNSYQLNESVWSRSFGKEMNIDASNDKGFNKRCRIGVRSIENVHACKVQLCTQGGSFKQVNQVRAT